MPANKIFPIKLNPEERARLIVRRKDLSVPALADVIHYLIAADWEAKYPNQTALTMIAAKVKDYLKKGKGHE